MGYVNLHTEGALEAFKRKLEIASIAKVAGGDLKVDDILGMQDSDGLAAFRLIRFGSTHGMPRCPKCHSDDAYALNRGRAVWKCAGCSHEYSVTSGTMMHGRKMGLRSYLCLLSIVLDKSQFNSIRQFSKEVRIDYKTTWTQINRFRACTVNNNGCSVPFSLLERSAFDHQWDYTRSNLSRFMLRPKDSFYPYLPESARPDDGRDLVEFVNRFAPKWMPDYMRADMCQDMILAILEGEATREQISRDSQKFLSKIFKQYPWKYKWISLDAPRSMDDDRTLGEMLTEEDYQERYDRARPEARPWGTSST